MKYVLLVFTTSVVALIGCESAVHPYSGDGEPYTLWGVMNSAEDTQKVRIFEIWDQPGIDRSGAIDAVVSSENLTTGERVVWSHREVAFDSGAVGHIFWAPFRAEERHRYRLEVLRSDGAISTAEVRVPESVDVEVDLERSTVPVRIIGDGALIGVEVRYEATNLPPTLSWPPERKVHPLIFHPVSVSYQDELLRIGDEWNFEIQMQRDYQLVRSEFERNCLVTDGAPDISLRRVELRFVAADSSWIPPGGEFDPDVLVEPGALSNVENGYGFLGAGQVVRVRWTPERDIRYLVGYSDDRPCNLEARPVPACMDPPIPCIGENPTSIWGPFFFD